MKRQKIFLVMMVLSVSICSGCSYKQAEDKIRTQIVQKKSQTEAETVADKDKNIKYVKLGETFPGWFEHSVEGYKDVYGDEGVWYKVKGIHIYDKLADSGVKIKDCDMSEVSGNNHKIADIVDNNKFIVVDMEITYKKTKKGMDDEICIGNDFWGYYQEDKVNANIFEGTKSTPECVYFSEHARDGDINFYTKEKMKQEINYYVCRKTIKNGKSISWKIGILVADDLIKEKNAFMAFGPAIVHKNEVEGTVTYMINLAEEATNEKSGKK